MSFFTSLFSFLFEEQPALSLEKVALLPPAEKYKLIQKSSTSAAILAGLIVDEDVDVRVLLAQRLSSLLGKLKTDDEQTSALIVGAIRQLTEDSVTPVRVALASALKDIAKTPPAIARKLADDAERTVAEPIIRYSLSLSDEDLLALISQYPQSWHAESIASRRRLSSALSDAVINTKNVPAGIALLANDTATISDDAINLLQGNPEFSISIGERNSLMRRLKRDVAKLTEHSLYTFLRNNAHLDKDMTKDVLKTMQQRVDSQENLHTIPPEKLTEQQMKDALLLGETPIVLNALAAKAKTDVATVKRMAVDSGAGKPVIALCVKAGISMSFAVLLQQRLTRLPPDKIFYAVNGTGVPITPEEVKWHLEFFGLA